MKPEPSDMKMGDSSGFVNGEKVIDCGAFNIHIYDNKKHKEIREEIKEEMKRNTIKSRSNDYVPDVAPDNPFEIDEKQLENTFRKVNQFW